VKREKDREKERQIGSERDYFKFNLRGESNLVNKFSPQVGFEPAIPELEDRHACIRDRGQRRRLSCMMAAV
jgi:hypothetical protein